MWYGGFRWRAPWRFGLALVLLAGQAGIASAQLPWAWSNFDWSRFDPAPAADYFNFVDEANTHGSTTLGYKADDSLIVSRYTRKPVRSVRSVSLWHSGVALALGNQYPVGTGNLYAYGSTDWYGNRSCHVNATYWLSGGQSWTAFDGNLTPGAAPVSFWNERVNNIFHKTIDIPTPFGRVELILDLYGSHSASLSDAAYSTTQFLSWTDTGIRGNANLSTGLRGALTAQWWIFDVFPVHLGLIDPEIHLGHGGIASFGIDGLSGVVTATQTVDLVFKLTIRIKIGGYTLFEYTWLNQTVNLSREPIADLRF